MNEFQGSSKERKEKISFLKKTLEQRDDEIAEIKDRILGLQQYKDAEKEARELELQKLRTDYQEMKDQLTSENNISAAKLAALEEFKRERENLLAKYQALEDEYQAILDEHQSTLDFMDNKKMLDRDRLKKDMVTRVNLVAAEFRKVSNKQMADTTKRTIRENVSIQAQLIKMSDKSVELMTENAELRKKNRSSQRNIKALEKSHHEHARKLASHHRISMMMQDKQKDMEALVAEFQERERHLEALEEESLRLKEQVEEDREEVEQLAKLCEDKEEERLLLDEELEAAQTAVEEARSAVKSASDVLRSALQFPAGENDGEALLTSLRDLLTQALASLPVPAAAEPSRPLTAATTISDVPFSAVSGPPRRSVSVQSAPQGKARGLPSHCLPGSLQLVPRPDEHIPTQTEKSRRAAPARGALPPRQRLAAKSESVLFSLL